MSDDAPWYRDPVVTTFLSVVTFLFAVPVLWFFWAIASQSCAEAQTPNSRCELHNVVGPAAMLSILIAAVVARRRIWAPLVVLATLGISIVAMRLIS